MNHEQLNERASLDAVAAADRMGLREGDEVANGSHTYRIVRVQRNISRGPRRSPGVYAKLVAEHGHFVLPSEREDFLDMRQPGWTRILREDAGATGALGPDEHAGGVNGVADESRGPL